MKSQFKNIRNYDFGGVTTNLDSITIAGIAIAASGTAAVPSMVDYYGSNQAVIDFDSCDYGVYTNNMNTTVFNAEMTNMVHGISVVNGINCTSNIQHNNIVAHSCGINLTMNNSVLSTIVAYNGIFMNAAHAVNGIKIFNGKLANKNAMILNNNITTTGTVSFGLAMMNADNYLVSNNAVTYSIATGSTRAYGVRIENCNSLQMLKNSVKGSRNGLRSDRNFAIFTSLAGGYFYKCNNVDSTYEGIFFQGFNLGQIQSNNIHHHINGLHVHPSGIIGLQTLQGNLWYLQNYPGVTLAAWNEDLRDIKSNEIDLAPNRTWNLFFANYPLQIDINPPQWFVLFPGTDENCLQADDTLSRSNGGNNMGIFNNNRINNASGSQSLNSDSVPALSDMRKYINWLLRNKNQPLMVRKP